MIAHAAQAPAERWLSRQLIARKGNFPRIVARIRNEPALIGSLLEGLTSKTPPVKFGSAKALWLLSETAPELLYPRFDFFLALLDCENHILRWNAARILACLAPVDADGKLEAALDTYLSPIPGPEMIAAGNAIQWASRIALAKPHLADRITRAIVGVRSASYKTAECRNVAIGHAIVSLDRFFHLIGDQGAIIDFVSAQLDNPRPATHKKAAAFLKKHFTGRITASVKK
jgi:hypothetical protein